MSTNTSPNDRPDSSSPSLGSVLVVGGCGFLGHHIVEQLQQNKTSTSPSSQTPGPAPTTLSVLDLHTTRNRLPSSSGVEYYSGDITSPSALRPIFAAVRPDIVIHTASPAVIVSGPSTTRDLYHRVNVVGTRNLLEAAAEAGVKGFVYTSSASAVSDGRSELVNADERWPYVPEERQTDYYALTKAEAEQLVIGSNGRQTPQGHKMLTLSLRPAGIIGEGDVQNVPTILRALKRGQTRFQLGANTNLFDFTYVGNVALAHVVAAAALARSHALLPSVPLDHERVDGEAFFITNDSPVYFWDFPRAVWKAAGYEVPLEDVWCISRRLGLVVAGLMEFVMGVVGKRPILTRQIVRYSCMTRYYSCQKAKDRLGYRPTVELWEGIKRAVTWCQELELREQQEKEGR